MMSLCKAHDSEVNMYCPGPETILLEGKYASDLALHSPGRRGEVRHLAAFAIAVLAYTPSFKLHSAMECYDSPLAGALPFKDWTFTNQQCRSKATLEAVASHLHANS